MSQSVTANDFACGAKQEHTNNGFKLIMHHEGGVYHVCVFNMVEKFWVRTGAYHTLTEARKVFTRYKRIVNL